MTHASHSIWARRRPPGPASCPAPPGSLPACGSEQCCSQRSPPQKRERPPAWLRKSGDYHLCSRIFWFGNIHLNIMDELVEWIWFQRDCTRMDLKTLIKSHRGCTKLTLSIRSWHAAEHQEAGDARLDWWSLMNSHSRWWSTSPS